MNTLIISPKQREIIDFLAEVDYHINVIRLIYPWQSKDDRVTVKCWMVADFVQLVQDLGRGDLWNASDITCKKLAISWDELDKIKANYAEAQS